MDQYINKDTYVGDTGKQLKDIKTNLVIFKARSNNTSTSISYSIEKTNTAKAEITQSGNILSFNIKQTVQWRYLNCVIIAKSDNVEVVIK